MGGVDAFSYSVILLRPAGGDGVLFALNRLDTGTPPSCNDAASAASAASCSADVAVAGLFPASAPSAEEGETVASSLQRPCWLGVPLSSTVRSVDAFGDMAEGSGCIKGRRVSY